MKYGLLIFLISCLALGSSTCTNSRDIILTFDPSDFQLQSDQEVSENNTPVDAVIGLCPSLLSPAFMDTIQHDSAIVLCNVTLGDHVSSEPISFVEFSNEVIPFVPNAHEHDLPRVSHSFAGELRKV
jgi:hypothetical protein